MKTISNDPFPLSFMTSIRTPSTYQSAIPIPNYRRELFFSLSSSRNILHSNAELVVNLTDGIIIYSRFYIRRERENKSLLRTLG